MIRGMFFLVALLAVSSFARAQTSGGIIQPDGMSYTIRFTVESRATAVCVHEVDLAGTEFVDRDEDGSITQADALGCTTTFVGDRVTPNSIRFEVSPPLPRATRIALRGYDGTAPGDPPPSTPSNFADLAAGPIEAPVILSAPTP